MKTFDIDFTDQLNEQQVRYLLKSELERNKLLIRQNKITLFRYEVKEDAMVLLYSDKDGSLNHVAIEHYFLESSDLMFNKEEHKRIVTTFKRIINDTDYPKVGAEDFYYKDGTGVSIEYSCLFDEVGRVITIVGQHVDVYLTHDRMVSTIRLLNEQVAMTDTLRQSYETMLYFDLKDYSFRLIQGTPEVRAASMKVSNVVQLAELFCKHYVDPAFQEGFMSFANEGTIGERLMGNRYVLFEYMTKNIGWCRARITPAYIDSNGHATKAIFTTESAADHHEALSVLRVAASRDGLTGLLNRITGEEAIAKSLAKKPAAIFALMDCDFFKNINDKLGHPTGDQVLIEIAKSLNDIFGDEIVMRMGGDEFIVFITDESLINTANEEGIKTVFTPLYDRLKQVNIPQLNGQNPSLSCGAVMVPADEEFSFQTIYELADHKLYEAKAKSKGSLISVKMQ